MINQLLRSVLDQDRSPVVVCDLEHTIVYMNDVAAENYKKDGGYELMGKSLLNCHPPQANKLIFKVVEWFAEDVNHNMIYTFKNREQNKDVYMVALRDENKKLIGYYEKHEFRDVESAKLYDFENPIK